MIRVVMRARVKSCGGGMDVRLRKGCVSRKACACGIRMKDWVIFTFSTLRDHPPMEGSLSRTR